MAFPAGNANGFPRAGKGKCPFTVRIFLSMKKLTDTKEIYWLFALKVIPGQEEAFRKISARLVASTSEETGCMNYEWNLSPDGTLCHIYERYVDAEAVKVHRQRNGEMVKELLTTATPVSFALYGGLTDEIRELYAGRNPLFMEPLGGFAR